MRFHGDARNIIGIGKIFGNGIGNISEFQGKSNLTTIDLDRETDRESRTVTE